MSTDVQRDRLQRQLRAFVELAERDRRLAHWQRTLRAPRVAGWRRPLRQQRIRRADERRALQRQQEIARVRASVEHLTEEQFAALVMAATPAERATLRAAGRDWGQWRPGTRS